MLESYEEGQQLHTEDFIDDYYLPEGKWEYAEVETIGEDIVTLHYYGIDGEEVKEWTRAEMEHMLGWDIAADDDRLDGDGGGSGSGTPPAFGDDDTEEDDDDTEDALDEERETESDAEPSPEEYEFF